MCCSFHGREISKSFIAKVEYKCKLSLWGLLLGFLSYIQGTYPYPLIKSATSQKFLFFHRLIFFMLHRQKSNRASAAILKRPTMKTVGQSSNQGNKAAKEVQVLLSFTITACCENGFLQFLLQLTIDHQSGGKYPSLSLTLRRIIV